MTDDALHCRGALLTPITGWFDPAPKGGSLRLAANSYLPARGDPAVRLPGLRRGDLVTLENDRVTRVNGAPPERLAERPEFAKLGAVHPSRPLLLETAQASSPRTAEIQRVVDLVCPFGFGQRALIVSPPKAGKTVMLQAIAEGIALNHPTAILLILGVDGQDEEERRGIVEGDPFGDRLQHHRLPGLGRGDDQRALAEAEGAHEIDDALDLGGARARGLRGLEQQRPRRMHGAELGELGALREPLRGGAVHARHAAVLERHEVAAAQPRQPDGGVSPRGR